MIDRKMRYTMSAVAWVGVFFWSLALLNAASATIPPTETTASHFITPVLRAAPSQHK